MPDPGEVAPSCTGLAGACAENGNGGENACIEYYGTMGAMQGAQNCQSPKTWNAGMTCKQVVPTAQMTGACQTMATSTLCLLEYKTPGACFACATSCFNTTCVSAP